MGEGGGIEGGQLGGWGDGGREESLSCDSPLHFDLYSWTTTPKILPTSVMNVKILLKQT